MIRQWNHALETVFAALPEQGVPRISMVCVKDGHAVVVAGLQESIPRAWLVTVTEGVLGKFRNPVGSSAPRLNPALKVAIFYPIHRIHAFAVLGGSNILQGDSPQKFIIETTNRLICEVDLHLNTLFLVYCHPTRSCF